MNIYTSSSEFQNVIGKSIFLKDPQASVFAATGYSIATGNHSIVLCYGLQESLRACAGLLTPWGDKIPVLLLCHVNEEEQIMLKKSFESFNSEIFQINSKNQLQTLNQEFKKFPVIIMSKEIDVFQEILNTINTVEVGVKRVGDNDIPDEIISLIKDSRKPVILAGKGTSGALDVMLKFAERISAPVLLTAGATTFPDEQINFLNNSNWIIIPSGNPVWLAGFISSDLIIAAGTGLSEVDWFGLKDVKLHRGKLIHISHETSASDITRYSVKMDVRKFFNSLLMRQDLFLKDNPLLKKLQWLKTNYLNNIGEFAVSVSNSLPLHPTYVIHRIVSESKIETIFVSEGGACGMWLWMHNWLRQMVFPVQNGTIGVSIPFALGVKTAYPERSVWAIMGDGAFYYHLSELESLRINRTPVAIFIFNDSSWGAIRLAQTFIYNENYAGTDIDDSEYAKIAELYGCDGITVRTKSELEDAIQRAKNLEHPLVVDVKVKRDAVPIAGANFVAAEFDGVFKWLLSGVLLSSIKNSIHKKIPFETFKLIHKTLFK